jgi:serine/threonine-protein kinase
MCCVGAELEALFPSPDEPPPPAPELAALPQIPGYEFETVLGRGGMGIVFRARHLKLNRLVAVKMMLAGAFAESREKERFEREALSVAGLRHPNIVQIYDVGDMGGRPYFTMELVDGGSLAQKGAGTPQPARQVAKMVATLAGAVQAAHACGIVHRDLKPANVLLTVDETPKIVDFGLARRQDDRADLTQTGVPVGTPSYMAPEQAGGRRDAVGPAVDVYALGAILYEELTGRPPFRGKSAAATLQKVLAEEPAPPAQLNPCVPRDLETICLKCLRKDSGQRYATASDLAADLERFLNHEPIHARPQGRMERCLQWAQRRPAAAALVITVTLFAAAGVAAAWAFHRQQRAVVDRQLRADYDVGEILTPARGRLDVGWKELDLPKLNVIRVEAIRAVDVARSGGASVAVQQEADAFLQAAEEYLRRARGDRVLLEAVVEVSAPQETNTRIQTTGAIVPIPPSADEQYATAFRHWGLDVDRVAEADIVTLLRAEPDGFIQEVIGALDDWMLQRRRQKSVTADWRRLYRLADRLDPSDRHRRLRAVLVGEVPLPADVAVGLIGVVSPWPAIWELMRGNALRALRDVRREVNPRTDPVLSVMLLAQANDAVGDAAGAERILSEATTARPGQIAFLNALGRLLEYGHPPRLDEAIGYYRAARSRRPDLGINLCRTLRQAGRTTDAVSVLRELLPLQPENPEIYDYLGIIAYEQKQFNEAVAAFRKAVELKPDFASAYCNLGIVLLNQKRLGEAEAALRKAVELKPDYADAQLELGNVLQASRRFDDAETAFRKAIEFDPDAAMVHKNLATHLRWRGRRSAAAAEYYRVVALAPDDSESYFYIGKATYELERFDEAEAAYRRVIALDPDLGAAYYNLCFTLLKKGRFHDAADVIENTIRQVPNGTPEHEELRRMQVQCARFLALDTKLPAIIDGTAKPKSPAEQADWARFCALKKRHAMATRFFAEAFKADPRLVQNPASGARYAAACTAALAGCRQGADGDDGDDAERERWRALARNWLRADLAFWRKVFDRSPTDRDNFRPALALWQEEPRLAGLRDAKALEILPADERQDCLALWADVEAVLSRADK